MDQYDDKAFCKIRLGRFKKFFVVDPKRYKLREGWAVCDDGRPQDLIMLFPRRDLFGYYKFRRDWLQTRRLQDVTGYVQADIEAAHKEAQKQIEEARKLMANPDVTVSLCICENRGRRDSRVSRRIG